MRELKLRYFLELVSNVGSKSRTEAQVLEEAHRKINKAVSDSSTRVLGLDKSISKVGTNTSTSRQVDLQRRLHTQVSATTQGITALDRALTRVGSNSSTERQISYLQRLGQVADQAAQRSARIRTAVANGLERAPERFAEGAAGFYAGRAMVAPPIRAYANLEEATQDLRIAMTDAAGNVSKDFAKISEEAERLGNQLPGTAKDFMMAARALIEQGTPTSVVAGGGLRAASYFGALMNMDQYQSAETIAKVREAYGLKDAELVNMADLMQKGRYAFGINPQDFRMVASYAAPTYNTLGLTGMDNAKKLLAIQGMAAQVGLESSSFGTNFSMMLQRVGQFDTRVNKNSKEAREVREMLGEHGIDMQFYTPKGEFAGIENMLQQLAKLQPLSTQDQQKVLTRMFGAEAGRPAQILVQKGMQEYEIALKKLDGQADLDTRITMKMETFAAKLESLTGVIENTLARMARQAGDGMKPVMEGAGNFLGGPISGFLERNPTAGTAGLLVGGAAGTWLGSRLGATLMQRLRGGAAAAPAAKVVQDKVFNELAKDVAAQAAKVAGAPGSAAAAGGAAAAGSGAALGIRGMLGRLGAWGGGAMLGLDLFGTSDEEIAILKNAERMRQGYRGKGFVDPRRLDMGPALAVSAPDAPTTEVAAGGVTEVKVGEGKLAVTVHLDDQRSWVESVIVQQPSLLKIETGSTNPGAMR